MTISRLGLKLNWPRRVEHCTALPFPSELREITDQRLALHQCSQHSTELVCKISTGLSCLFVHIYGKKITKRHLFFLFYIYEGNMQVYNMQYVHLHIISTYLCISTYPIYQTQATFLVFSIAVGPKCSYNFVPPMNCEQFQPNF